LTRRACVFLAGVIGDNRLDDGQAKARPVLPGRVIRCEQAAALLFAESLSGIGNVEANAAVYPVRDDAKLATLWHRINCVQQQILHDTPQLFAVRTYGLA